MSKKVINLTTKAIYNSIREAAENSTATAKNISDCCHNKKYVAGTYEWQFYEENVDQKGDW